MAMQFTEIRDTIRKLSEENVSLNTFFSTWQLIETGKAIQLASNNVVVIIPIEEVASIRVDGFGYLIISTRGFCGFHILYSFNADGDMVRQTIDIPFAVHDFLKELNKVLDESGRELVARINQGDDFMIGGVIIPRHGLKRILIDEGVLVLVYDEYSLQFRTKKVIRND